MMTVPGVIIALLFFGILFMAKKLVDFQKEFDKLQKLNQKYISDINKVKTEARSHTSEIITKSTEKNIKQSLMFQKIKKIVSSLETQDICTSAFELLQKELGARKVAILIFESKAQCFTVLASSGLTPEETAVSVNRQEQSLIGLAVRSNITVDINGVQNEQSFSGLIGKGALKTVMAAPIHHAKSKEIIGVLNIGDLESLNYGTDERNLFNMVASLLEVAFHNSLAYESQLEASEMKSHEMDRIKNVFGRYVSPQILTEIMSSPDSIDVGGRNSKITVLASDIRSFTKMAEKLPPQEMVTMLNDYFSVMTEIVNMNHGCVDKFIGDAMMVLFGAPVPTPNDCINAIRCAVEMQDAIKIFEEKWREEKGADWNFKIGIGMNYGEVVIGNIGSSSRMEYTAIGDNVNVAFRLESIAPGGNILITESLYDQVREYILVEKLQPTSVKGRVQPVQVYKVIGIK